MGWRTSVTRFAAEMVTALVTFGLGSAVMIGAREYGTGWTESGPEPGAFPFYVGVLVMAASVGNLVWAWRKRRPGAVFLDAPQLRRIAAFGLPLLGFVALSVTLGFYVAIALYLGAVMRLQGKYRWVPCIAVAFGTSAFFFLVLEVWFKVPLLKGPLEAALRLH
ncbi:MAG: tripartite tricarboxylate transporter TctB family protein [Casimicrobiaceae bacterium]|nr:tripartite tricarboxylate transporter TctB family protein [Pseudomonadota bacterium]